jgi:hypothetical protein
MNIDSRVVSLAEVFFGIGLANRQPFHFPPLSPKMAKEHLDHVPHGGVVPVFRRRVLPIFPVRKTVFVVQVNRLVRTTVHQEAFPKYSYKLGLEPNVV